MKKIDPVPSISEIEEWDFFEGKQFSLVGCDFVDAEIYRDGGTCELLFYKHEKKGALMRIMGYFLRGNIHFGKFLYLDIEKRHAILLHPDQIIGLEAFLDENRARIPENIRNGLLMTVK